MNFYQNQALTMMQVYQSEEKEKLYMWLNRFEYVADILGVPDDKMVEFFKKMVDDGVHKYVRDANPYVNFSELSYKQITDYYLSQLTSNTLSFCEDDSHEIDLFGRNQYEEETLEKYIDRLRKIHENCCHTSDSEQKLCQQFINGCRNDELRKYLRENPDLSFDEMVAKAIKFVKGNDISHYINHVLSMINIYKSEKEGSFHDWLNYFEYVVDVVKVPNYLMVELFNKMVDTDVHKYVKETNPYVKFSDISYKQIIYHYLRKFTSNNENDVHRTWLSKRSQYEEETLEKYIDRLRKIRENCCHTSDSKKRLCEQFINGCRNDELRKYLREIPSLSFDEIVAKAIEFEKGNNVTHYEDQPISMSPTYKKEKEDDLSWYRNRALTMMTVLETIQLGILEQYHSWLNRFEYVANIIGVPKDKMIEFFYKMVNDDVHNYVKQKNLNFNLHGLPYDTIINHYFHTFNGCKYNIYRICLKFRNQYEQEPIKHYANYLLKLNSKCDYKHPKYKGELRNKFFHGLRENVIRTYLGKCKNYLFDKMVAKAIEFAKINLITYYRDLALLKIHTYTGKNEGEFYVWLNKFEYVADTLDVPDNKMIELFNEMIDNDVHTCVKKTFQNVNFSKLSYDEILNHYLRHFSPDVVELHRLRLFYRKQYDRETIENYAYNLRKLFNKCIFTTDLEQKLFEQFIKGLRVNEVRNHLLETSYESFDEIVAKAIEFAKVHLITYYRDKALLKIDIYNEEKEGNFFVWLNKFEYVADMINVPESKMGKLFIEMVDNDFNRCVMQANPSVDFYENAYDKIVDYYFRFFTPEKEYLHRNHFKSRHQYEHEPTKTYAYFIHKYYTKSKYVLYRDKDLRDKFLNGLRENDTRNHLEKSPQASFDDTVKMAIEYEKVNLIMYYRDQVLLKINTYSPRREGVFYSWLNKFEYVADMIDVPENKMVELFNEMINNNLPTCVKQTFKNASFSKLSYDEIINNYLRHFSPDVIELHKPRIFCRKQYERETIKNYAHSLQKLFNKCIFTTDLEQKFCKHFIYGLRENEVKNHLLETNYESFDEMVADAIEFAKVNLITYYRDHALLKIAIYNGEKEGEFDVWLNRFEYVADMIHVPDNKMIELFNEMIDNDVHMRVKHNFENVNFSKLPYDEIIYHYIHYFFPDVIDLYRLRIFSRKQFERETVENYVYNLRKLFNKCINTSDLEDLLSEHFIKGLREDDLRNFLTGINYKSFDELVIKAVELEKVNLMSYYRDKALLKMNIYNPRKEDEFYVWLNRFEYVADKIKVPDNKLVKLFFEMIDDNVNQRIMQAFPSVQFSELSYNQIIQHYLSYFAHEEDSNKKRFQSRDRYEEETEEEYAFNLRKLSKQCYFSSKVENELRSRYINGIRNKNIRIHLLRNPTLSFEQMVRSVIELKVRMSAY